MVLAKDLRPLRVVAVIFAVRILSVFLVKTWYVPDEYWQSLEVAHKQVFGYGALTWEWQQGIRSYLYPTIVAALYTILKYTGLDYPDALIYLPRILQAGLSAATDYSFYKWTGGRKWALFLILTSWFWFYTSGRTLIQTTETALVTIALSVFPFKDGLLGQYEKENKTWIWLACISVFVRPTTAALWLVLGAYNLATTNQSRLQLVTRTYLPIGLVTGGALVALDSYFHGSLVVTPWEFFKLNVLNDIASFYGSQPWHWYITQGVPAILGIHLLPVLVGAAATLRRPRENRTGAVLLTAAALHLVLHSFIKHKEFRFALPLLPAFLYVAQDAIVRWSRKAKRYQLYTVAVTIAVCSAIPALYCGQIHQSGAVGVMPLLREAIPNNRSSILFLMPCHSTPLYSHLHVNVTARYLHCDPPIDKPNTATESEAFYNNPLSWWRTEHATRQTPDLVVLYDILLGRVEGLLAGYKKLYEVPHTQYPLHTEMGKNILVYQKGASQPKKRADETI